MRTNITHRFVTGILFWGPFIFTVHELPADESQNAHLRRPIAIVVRDDQELFTANYRAGTISHVKLPHAASIREFPIGEQLSDLCLIPSQPRFLATDEGTHQLLAIRQTDQGLHVENSLAVARFPVSVCVSRDASLATIASLWSKTITIVDLARWLGQSETKNPAVIRQIQLPFSPRQQLLIESDDLLRRLPSDHSRNTILVVADAFGSKIGTIDIASGRLLAVREIPGHAIRQLRLHPTKPLVLITHQLVYRLGHTTFDDVHWGGLMANCLRSVRLTDLLEPDADLGKHSIVDYIGGPERGAADPAGLAIRPDGTVAVAISGTNEFAIDDGNFRFSTRLPTESLPTAVALSSDGNRAYIVNSLSDSISIVDLSNRRLTQTVSLGPQPDPTPADRGEKLFHNAELSHDRWLSCASCHVDGHTNGLLTDNFTDASFGTAKRVLSLRGVTETAPYAWNGKLATLQEQIEHSIQSTMQGTLPRPQDIDDLAAFLKTLPPPPGVKFDDATVIERGSRLFRSLDCQSCHTPPTYTSAQVVNVSLTDEKGNSTFNPPSLRGVSHNGPYFHDGRATTLQSVFQDFHHQLDRELTPGQLDDLTAFLQSL